MPLQPSESRTIKSLLRARRIRSATRTNWPSALATRWSGKPQKPRCGGEADEQKRCGAPHRALERAAASSMTNAISALPFVTPRKARGGRDFGGFSLRTQTHKANAARNWPASRSQLWRKKKRPASGLDHPGMIAKGTPKTIKSLRLLHGRNRELAMAGLHAAGERKEISQ